jgi:predicted ATPase/class 3 adenylate cyclase
LADEQRGRPDDRLPGTHTFLLTDIEGSTRTWEREPEAMARWLACHDGIVTDAVRAHGGRVFKHTGDGLCSVFPSPAEAARAARDIQVALAASSHERTGGLRARIALHTGDAIERGGDFFGPTLNRCARLLGVAHGGQILVSGTTATRLGTESAGAGVGAVDLGQHRLRDLQEPEHIWQLVAPDLQRAFPALRSLDAFLHNLPVQRSSFVGRETEMRALRDLLASQRLVTVTGVGGCGKTRLALEVAARETERFADGVFLADLSSVLEPNLVASAIAAALRMLPGPGATEERLVRLLVDRHTLIVVDNCEHLLDGCAAVLDRLLSSCPRVSILATSREALALDGEHVWRVPSLGVPDGDGVEEVAAAESVRLFVDRASAVRAGFALGADNAADVAAICRRLDGIPLALELAAARIAHLAPREIVQRLADRFRLLTGGRRGLPRQQTLQAVLDWSHELLTEPERVLLRRLSVFAGGWRLDAARAVCGGDPVDPEQVVDVLGTLVSRSLVDAENRGDHTRYRLLETVRVYAQERLIAAGEAPAARGAHAEWFVRLAETPPGGPAVAGMRQWFGYESLDLVDELDNLREAAEWGLAAGRRDLMLRIAATTVRAFQSQGRIDEADAWLLTLPEMDMSSGLRARCYAAWAEAAEMRGDFALANERARKGIAAAERAEDAGGAYSILVANLTWMDPNEAERLLASAPDWTTSLGPLAESYLLTARGTLACARHDYDQAVPLLSQAISLDDVSRPFHRRVELCVVHLLRGDVRRAEDELDARRGDPLVRARTWSQYYEPYVRALIAAVRGEVAAARAKLVETAALVRRWKIPLGLADCVVGCAVLAFHGGDVSRASELLAAVRAATGGGLRSPMSMCLYRHYVREVRAVMSREAMVATREAGARLTLEAAVARELGPVSGKIL